MTEPKWTNEDSIKYNTTVYQDMNDLERYTNLTENDLKEEIELGFIQELTPVTSATIIDTLTEEVWDDSFQMMVEQLNEDNPDDLIPLETTALIREYTEMYKLFHIKETGQWFVDLD